jgi:Cdc6-like AAA superfamily ATPase
MAVTSRVRKEADALRKASENGESEIAAKISRKQHEEHTSTENMGSNFERNHFRNLPSSNGERLWPVGEGKLGLRKIAPTGSKFRVPTAPFTGLLNPQ